MHASHLTAWPDRHFLCSCIEVGGITRLSPCSRNVPKDVYSEPASEHSGMQRHLLKPGKVDLIPLQLNNDLLGTNTSLVLVHTLLDTLESLANDQWLR